MEGLFLDRHKNGDRPGAVFHQVSRWLFGVDDADGIGRGVLESHPDRLF